MVFDFGRVLIFPKDLGYFGGLNDLHKILSESPNYKLTDHFEFNSELLEFLKQQKTLKGIEFYLYTKGTIVEDPACHEFLSGFFKQVYFANKIKFEKNDPQSYKFLSDNISFDPSEIIYVDDDRENTAAAEEAGLLTITFRNNMQFETEFEGYV